ncbi:hypothetical protein COCMIDRAFT_110536, partial [Bipolaris oryzae ATCC 44560]
WSQCQVLRLFKHLPKARRYVVVASVSHNAGKCFCSIPDIFAVLSDDKLSFTYISWSTFSKRCAFGNASIVALGLYLVVHQLT